VISFSNGTNQTAIFDNFTLNAPSGDLISADPSTSTVVFNTATADAGTNPLLDAAGAGTVATLTANASTLTGSIQTGAGSTSNLNLLNGSTWNLTAPSNVSNLAVTNSVVVFAPPGAGGGFKTLTVGNYVGSGATIVMNAALGGSTSAADLIVVNGGSATGTTVLSIKNVGAGGGQTSGNGIPLVVARNGGTIAPDAFALANSPVVGGFRYTLNETNGDWFLVSAPAPTQGQVQSSVTTVAKAQQAQAVTGLELRLGLRLDRLARLRPAGPLDFVAAADPDRRSLLQPVERAGHFGLRRSHRRRVAGVRSLQLGIEPPLLPGRRRDHALRERPHGAELPQRLDTGGRLLDRSRPQPLAVRPRRMAFASNADR
jgi:hypothetical protein